MPDESIPAGVLYGSDGVSLANAPSSRCFARPEARHRRGGSAADGALDSKTYGTVAALDSEASMTRASVERMAESWQQQLALSAASETQPERVML